MLSFSQYTHQVASEDDELPNALGQTNFKIGLSRLHATTRRLRELLQKRPAINDNFATYYASTYRLSLQMTCDLESLWLMNACICRLSGSTRLIDYSCFVILLNRSVPVYFIWLKYISWFSYSNEILVVNQWKSVQNISKCKGFESV
jgi:hypothetical protein